MTEEGKTGLIFFSALGPGDPVYKVWKRKEKEEEKMLTFERAGRLYKTNLAKVGYKSIETGKKRRCADKPLPYDFERKQGEKNGSSVPWGKEKRARLPINAGRETKHVEEGKRILEKGD